MSAVRNWLEEIGHAQYADAFEANDIDTDLLTQIDDQVLKGIGVSSAGIGCACAMPSPNWPPHRLPKEFPNCRPRRPRLRPSGGS
jgi:hypothetical protein